MCADCNNSNCTHIYTKRKQLFARFSKLFDKKSHFREFFRGSLNAELFSNVRISWPEFQFIKKSISAQTGEVLKFAKTRVLMGTLALNWFVSQEIGKISVDECARRRFRAVREAASVPGITFCFNQKF